MAKLSRIHPVLPCREVNKAVEFYGRLGFKLMFTDSSEPRRYAGIFRDGIELDLQWHSEAEFNTCRAGVANMRLSVDDPDALYKEYATQGAIRERQTVKDTDWGTREFGLLDPDGNALTFYKAV
jgi:catechol 2,3-dioxygenase-like lactoylglutathione lyase family enzyme